MPALQPWGFSYLSESSSDLSLDLSFVTFVKPAAIVALCTKVERLVSTGTRVSVQAPQSTDVSNYLCRARLPGALDALGVPHNFGTVNERAQGFSLVELAPFSDAASVSSLADSVHSFASAHSDEIASALHLAVCEAGENVGFHSGLDHGYLMAQYFPGVGSFEFALGDSGKGFFANLEPVGAASAHEAIEMAVTSGVTSTGDANRGKGIAAIRRDITKLGGDFGIASGEAFHYFYPGIDAGRVQAISGSMTGSLVVGKINTRRRFAL